MREKKKYYQDKYPKGTRVEIIELCNDESNYPPGTKGTVDRVDDCCQIHVIWDNGGSIALLPEEGDIFKILEKENDKENLSLINKMR